MWVGFQDAVCHPKHFELLGIIFSDCYWLINLYDPLSSAVSKDTEAAQIAGCDRDEFEYKLAEHNINLLTFCHSPEKDTAPKDNSIFLH